VGSAGTNVTFGAVSTSTCVFVGIGSAVTTAAACTNATGTQVPVPAGGTVKSFYVATPGYASGHNEKLTYTVRKNGATTTATCTPSSTAATTCSVSGLSVPFAAGDLIDVQIEANAGSPPTPPTFVTWGVQYQ
jgi:hypothetical protein